MVKAVGVGAFAVLLLLAGDAHAQFRDWRASADLHMDSGYVHAAQSGDGEERNGQASVGLALRATVGKSTVQYGAGLSYRFGSSFPGGFAYAVDLLPLGVGLVFSDRFRFVVRAGGGVSGVTGRVPFAGELPVEAQLETRLTRWLALGAFARVSWTTGTARERGIRSLDFGDELRAGIRVRVGKHYRHGRRMRGSDGYYVAALVSESRHTRFVGGAVGYGLDFVFGR